MIKSGLACSNHINPALNNIAGIPHNSNRCSTLPVNTKLDSTISPYPDIINRKNMAILTTIMVKDKAGGICILLLLNCGDKYTKGKLSYHWIGNKPPL